MQLNDNQQMHCSNFENPNSTIQKNTCSVQNRSLEFQLTPRSVHCMTCTIRDVNITRNAHCQKTLTCAALVFSDQTIFETFFARNRHAVADSFPSGSNESMRPRLYISIEIEHYNSSKLTLQDIAKTININSLHMAISVNLTQLIWSSPVPINLTNGFPIRVFRFVLYVCDDKYRRSWYSYKVGFKQIRNNIIGPCEKLHSFKELPISTTTTSSLLPRTKMTAELPPSSLKVHTLERESTLAATFPTTVKTSTGEILLLNTISSMPAMIESFTNATEVTSMTTVIVSTQPPLMTTIEQTEYSDMTTSTATPPHRHRFFLHFLIGALFLIGVVVISIISIILLYLCRTRPTSATEELLTMKSSVKPPSDKKSCSPPRLIQDETEPRSLIRLSIPFDDDSF